MPLRAFINGDEVLAPLISDADWQLFKSKGNEIVLPNCGHSAFLRASKLGTKHFVHKTKKTCNCQPESAEHLLAKSEILLGAQDSGYHAQTEVVGSDWRADVLATKQSGENLIKVALEVQISSQTLALTQERQNKYKRDGIRCCWLFKKLPSNEPSHELPMFRLVFKDNLPFVLINNRFLPLRKFITALLNGEFRFCQNYRLTKKQKLTLIFIPVRCCTCLGNYYVYGVEGSYRTVCGYAIPELTSLEPFDGLYSRAEVLEAVKQFLKTSQGKSFNMCFFKSRYGEVELAFQCPHCTFMPDGYHYHWATDKSTLKAVEAIYREIEIDLPDKTRVKTLMKPSHWCYSPDHYFCSHVCNE